MSPVLDSVNPVNLSLLFSSRFCHHCRWNIPTNKIEIDFNLLRGLDAPPEKIRESGRAKSIGVSNFEEPHLTALFEFSGIIPAVNQIECHPLWNRKPLIAFCRSHGIAVQAYAPLARGLYLNREIMQQLAEKYVRTEAQIGLRYLVQQGISVIPKSTQPDRIFANADVFDFELSEADMALIDTMDEQLRSASIPDDLL